MKTDVLFLLHLPPPVHGSSVMGKYIYESKLINSTFNTRYINMLASKDVDSSGKVNLNKVTGFVKVLYSIINELIIRKPTVCYFALTTTGAAFYRDVIVVSILKVFGIKRIYHIHNKGIKRWATKLFNKSLYKFVFKNSEVILLSRYLYQDIDEFVPEQNIHICPNGIPKQKVKQSEKETKAPVRILYLSNLIRSKGVYILLEACSLLKKKGLSFQCDFIGGVGDVTKDDFDKKVKGLQLTKIVHYLGKKYGDEKEYAFSCADIFAFPTYYPNECLPLVIIEAMQHRLPVISTFEGGIRDLIDDNKTGFLVSQKNAKELAEKLEHLILNKDLRKHMGEAGYQKYKQDFTIQKFEETMCSVLAKINSD